MIVYRSMYDGSARVLTTTVIANQRARWCGNPFPMYAVRIDGNAQKTKHLGNGLPRRFAPRNDSGGRQPDGTNVRSCDKRSFTARYLGSTE